MDMPTRKNLYFFALGDILKEKNLNQVEARKKYGFARQGAGYISRTGFVRLCNRPKQIKMETLSLICAAMNLTPAELFRPE
jgi:DNA-binding Xre family transcriptional regulator